MPLLEVTEEPISVALSLFESLFNTQ